MDKELERTIYLERVGIKPARFRDKDGNPLPPSASVGEIFIGFICIFVLFVFFFSLATIFIFLYDSWT